MLQALLPALREHYGRDGWRTERSQNKLGDAFIAPDGTRLGKLRTNKSTKRFLRLLGGDGEPWASDGVLEWAGQAVLAKLERTSQRDLLVQYWTTGAAEEGDPLTVRSASGLLVAEGLPADHDPEFRKLMRKYAGDRAAYWFSFGG